VHSYPKYQFMSSIILHQLTPIIFYMETLAGPVEGVLGETALL
jgi:hypothetical protein